MISRTFYFILLITITVKSENNTFNNVMENILSDYSNSTSTDKNFSPWFFKQMINIQNCGTLPKVNKSRIQYIMKWKEQKIYLKQKCNRYFEASRENTIDIVCVNGKWIYEDKKCKLITCPTFDKPVHSYMTNVPNTYNSVVYFSCSSGYFLRGNSSIRCEETKQWSSPPPVCEITTCLPPHQPKHGNVSTKNEVEVNETIYFNCSEPYTLNGESVLTCLENGRWNIPAPVCTLNCFVPEIAGRVMTISQDTILKPKTLINEGEKVLYSCNRSFIPVAFGVVHCMSGKWYPDIQCKKTCKIEKQNGLKFNLSRDVSVIEYSCLPGATLLGDSKRTCLENGTWSGKLPICVKNCQLLPNFGIFSYRNSDNLQYLPFGISVPENTNITYLCQRNYSISNETAVCHNGIWTPQPRCSFRNIRLSNDYIMFRESSSEYNVCQKDYSCKFFGYGERSCRTINCRYNDNCVNISFNNETSEISFVRNYDYTCCALRCYDN